MMQTAVEIGSDGNVTVLVVNPLEDLFYDYQYFLIEALKADDTAPGFLQKRFLRAALVVYVTYCGGVVDEWCRVARKKEGKSDADTEKWVYENCLEKKCEYLTGLVTKKGIEVENPRYEFKRIRNRIIHLHNRGALEFYADVTPVLLQDANADMEKWFDTVGTALKCERHSSSADVADAFKGIGLTTKSHGTEPPAFA